MNVIKSWLKVLSGETGRKGQVPFYTLVQSLHQVAQLSVQNVQLVRNKKLIRIQQQDCHHLQSQISQYWTEFRKRKITEAKLLKVCSKLNGSSQTESNKLLPCLTRCTVWSLPCHMLQNKPKHLLQGTSKKVSSTLFLPCVPFTHATGSQGSAFPHGNRGLTTSLSLVANPTQIPIRPGNSGHLQECPLVN